MTPELAGLIWTIAAAYAVIGVLVALIFVTALIKRVSPGARTAAPLQFRILVFPACVALWPALLGKLVAPKPKEASHETTA
ncbi:hypothetical protein ACWCOP_08005 [Maricaulaceae bacterium MS644]